MWALYVLLAPLVALIVWGVVYDIKRRRRGLPTNDHDVSAAAKKLRAGRRTSAPDRADIGDIGDVFGP
jgi:hypothetical protein